MRPGPALGLALLLLSGAPLRAGELAAELAETRALLEQLDRSEAGAQVAAETLKAEAKRRRPLLLDRGSVPSVAYGHLGGTFQDLGVSGLGQRRASAARLGVYLRLEGGLPGGASYYLVMDVRHDPDDDDVILPRPTVYSALSSTGQVAFHRLRVGAKGRAWKLDAGYLELNNSELTYAGSTPGRPSLFDRDRYAENQTSQSFYEYLVQTGAQSRFQPVQYPWGLQSWLGLGEKGELFLFLTNLEGYYAAPSPALRDAGGHLTWKLGAGPDDSLGLAAYNRSNDRGEIVTNGGSPSDPANGLQNASVVTALVDQGLLGLRLKGEGGWAWHDQSVAGRHLSGAGVDLSLGRDWGGGGLALVVQSMQPGFVPGTDKGVRAAVNGFAFQVGSDGAAHPATVLTDPAKPVLNAGMLGLRMALRPRFGRFTLSLRSGSQASPSTALLTASHALGGDDTAGALWWTALGGTYSPWTAPAAPSSAADATSARARGVDLYNRSSYTGAALTDAAGSVAYGARPYHLLDTSGWRDNTETLVLADPATGRPLEPAVRHLSYASADWRFSLGELLGLDRGLYLLLFQDLLGVASQPQALPSLTADTFSQAVGQATAVLQAGAGFYLLLNAGYEEWRSDAQPLSVRPFSDGLASHPGRLEYHDRQAGAGLDWDAVPNQLAFYVRFKILDHHDSAFEGNDFQSRQLWLEAKSFF